jgi:hypothetical protein
MRCDLDDLWRHSQDPALHARWDLRFSRIALLPRGGDDEPQRFTYERRLLPGLRRPRLGRDARRARPRGRQQRVGAGVRLRAAAVADPRGLGLLALRAAARRRALPHPVRLRAALGRGRRTVDRLVFRRLIAWATAWSFDRLRLWLEEGVPPERSLRAWLRVGPGRVPAPGAAAGGRMTSIYRRALGADFERLHPRMQARFGFSSADGIGQVGTGVMEEIWRGPAFTVPFLLLGTWRRIMFPATGATCRSRSRTTPTSIASGARR